MDLSARNLQLSSENAELSSRLRADQGAVQMLTERLALVSREHEEGATTLRQLQETSSQQERERFHLQEGWQHEKELLERELATTKEKVWWQSLGQHWNFSVSRFVLCLMHGSH